MRQQVASPKPRPGSKAFEFLHRHKCTTARCNAEFNCTSPRCVGKTHLRCPKHQAARAEHYARRFSK